MKGSIIAKRYAKALVKLTGLSLDNIEKHRGAFEQIRSLFMNEQASQVLSSKAMPSTLKKQLLDYALEKAEAPAHLCHFVSFVLKTNRLELLLTIFDLYIKMLEKHNNVLQVTVESFAQLSEQKTKELTAHLEKMLDKQVTLKIRVNEELLGGFIVRFENFLIDLTLKHKLDQLTANVVL